MNLFSLLEVTLYFCFLSLLTVGGGLTVSSDMNRFLVTEKGYLTHAQFTESIALAQAAPGPNILFVALLGWQVGGLPGAILLQIAIVLPSSLLAYYANRWRTGRRTSQPFPPQQFPSPLPPSPPFPCPTPPPPAGGGQPKPCGCSAPA
jgi:hypothetical protein